MKIHEKRAILARNSVSKNLAFYFRTISSLLHVRAYKSEFLKLNKKKTGYKNFKSVTYRLNFLTLIYLQTFRTKFTLEKIVISMNRIFIGRGVENYSVDDLLIDAVCDSKSRISRNQMFRR